MGHPDPDQRRVATHRHPGAHPAALTPLGIAATAFLAIPLLALLLRAPWSDVPAIVAGEGFRSALGLSLACSLGATLLSVVFGVPLALLLARADFPGRALLRALATLPLVLPPVVGGVALLFAFGRSGVVGAVLFKATGWSLPFTTAGAVVAETFVAMPFLVIAVEAGLRGVDPRLEEAAASLGAGAWTAFWRVTLPLVRPSLVAGAVLCWARALGEFGATITFAGNFPGRTQTLPLAVYLALESGQPREAVVLGLVLLLVSVTVLVALRNRWWVAA